FVEFAAGGAGDPDVAHVGAAETEIGDGEIGNRRVFGRAIGVEGRDAAVENGGDADLAACLDLQAVEQLVAGKGGDDSTGRPGDGRGFRLPWSFELHRPQAPAGR